MVVAIGLHRVDEAQFIDMLCRVGHEFADPHARLAILLKSKGAFEDLVIATVEDIRMAGGIECVAERCRHRFAVELFEEGFVIEGVDLGGATDHEKENHGLCAGRKVGRLGSQGVFEGTAGEHSESTA